MAKKIAAEKNEVTICKVYVGNKVVKVLKAERDPEFKSILYIKPNK